MLHSRYHRTTAQEKSSKQPLSHHWPTSNSSLTTIFPWLTSTLQVNYVNNCVVAQNIFKMTPRHKPRTENTCHVFSICPVYWCAGCCLQKTHVHFVKFMSNYRQVLE
jgi:hypothetical protein